MSAPTADAAHAATTPHDDDPATANNATDAAVAAGEPPAGDDIVRLTLGDREIVLVGTAHVSRSSVEQVRTVIEAEAPDAVCIELDEKRYQSLAEQKRWESLDLREIIRRKQLFTLLINLLLAAYQKRLGGQLGIEPGTELLEAARIAEAGDIPIALCDRDVRVTLRRAARLTPFHRKIWLFASLLASLFDDTTITEEDLQTLRQQDVLTELMDELGRIQPNLKQVLVDERDTYLAARIHATAGDRLVAVVGAGHLRGIEATLRRLAAPDAEAPDLAALEHIPPVSPVWKIIGWALPLVIVGSVAWIGVQQGGAAAGDNALYWVLANGIPSSIGALIALAHPATIATAFFAAPITSLSPLIGAAYVCAFVQVWFAPPTVKEFKTVADDAGSLRRWWGNRLLRIFLTFVLVGLGSTLGSVVGGVEILTNLLQG
ncbi:MAG: TraB/GumN family protein [Acidobacteriota bacterium]